MRKSKIAAAMLMVAATAGVNAAHINTDGTGQVALLPYYNVNNSFITNINITNTTNLFKAVKVRFRESRISADVLDFNLYMSPYDVWNGTIRLVGSVANLITEDETCTYPDKSLLQAGVNFRNIYAATTDEDLTEGYVEIIEMGVIADGPGPAIDDGVGGPNGDFAEIEEAGGAADGVIDGADRAIVTGLLHGTDGVPADCSVVADAWTAGAANAAINGFEPGALSAAGIATDGGAPDDPYDDGLNAGLVDPTGGINAYSIMINTATGAAFVEQGTHIDAYATVPQHFRSDDQSNYLLPSLASGDITYASMMDASGTLLKSDFLPLVEYDTGSVNDIAPNPSIPMGSNPLPIALVLSADAISAPYFVESSINGETDIVVTFPMRKHGIYNSGTLTNQLDPLLAACVGDLTDASNQGDSVQIPTLGTTGNDYPNDGAGNYCGNAGYAPNANPDVEVSLTYYDYEEQEAAVVAGTPGFSPVPITATPIVALEREVNVVSVNRSSGGNQSVLGTPAANVFDWSLDPGFEAGWVTINMAARYNYNTNPSINAMTQAAGIGATTFGWTGVPVIGFTAMAGNVGPAQLGETVDLIRHVNRN